MEFADQHLQKKFSKNGYVVIDLLDEEEMNALQKIYDTYPPLQVANFQVSNYEKNPEKNRLIDQAIREVISAKIAAHFRGYKLLTAFFYIKFPGKDSAFYIHKDWNIVDESKDSSIHIWIPLCDTTPLNGNFFICPFDYKKQLTFRGSPGFEYPAPSKFTKFINSWYRKNIFTRRGQAICFEHRLSHGSATNQTDKARVSAGISLIPANAQMVHYTQNKQGEIIKHDVKDNFYLDFDLNGLYQSV